MNYLRHLKVIVLNESQNKSKSDQKSVSSKSRTKIADAKVNNDFILQEKWLNSIKCDLWINEKFSESSKTEDARSPKTVQNRNTPSSDQNSTDWKLTKK